MTAVQSNSSIILQEIKEKNWPMGIEELSLQRCNLKEIDSTLFKLRGLIRLDLSQNQLSNFRGEFPYLRNLNLSGNLFQEFPQCDGLPALKKINLSRNLIVQLPRMQIGRFVKHLNVSHNQIEVLPRACLERITSLNAEHNFLKSFPKKIFNQLTVVCLLGNPVRSLDLSVIPNVRVLTLSLSTFRIVAERLNLRGLRQVIVENGELSNEDQATIYSLDNNLDITFEEPCLNS